MTGGGRGRDWRQVVSLSQSSSVSPVELTDGRGGRGGRGAKSYDRKKAWSEFFRKQRIVVKTFFSLLQTNI